MIIADVLQITACESDMSAGVVAGRLVHRFTSLFCHPVFYSSFSGNASACESDIRAGAVAPV